ncbi:3-dehydroquinate synthase [Lentilactobacillus parakefiri]|uniref:3-dehydroquinate synthase n=1 Tax=Lentilactobacillus parakefiri TaxID=152332 RepID=A0A269YCI5_9LACO|nr:3-dehydroquinate synthase [Lentilactobacillus parakefiri]PAK83255.1 3-dehydroquinate synthase [Lentilactobacillus parakefiri]
MKIIKVALPDHSYNVEIARGILGCTGQLVSSVWSKRKIALVSDSNVAPLYQAQVAEALEAVGFTVHEYQFPAGEESKSLAVLADLARQMATDRFNRDDGVIALGGGVTGDLAGFLAATYMRGISLIQMPTSLLAQVDSSVGGKTAVDLDTTKNIIGSFYQPDLVIIDPNTLKTLKTRDLVEGYGEIVKVAALSDGDLCNLVKSIDSPDDILTNAEELSIHSIQYKTDIVMGDEKEGGLRQLLNYGHTIGHAVEALSDGGLRHGEAVSIGIIAMQQIFEDKGLAVTGITQELRERLEAVGLPTTSDLLDSDQVFEKIKNDKKNRDGHLSLIYIHTIGGPVIKSIPSDQVKDFLAIKTVKA